MQRAIHFSEGALTRLPPPQSDRDIYRDRGFPGLYLRKCKNSSTFYYQRTIDGRFRRWNLGSWPLTSVREARMNAARVKVDLDQKRDPGASEKALRDSPTVGRMWTEFLEHKKGHISEPSLNNYRILFEKHLCRICNDRLGSLTKAQIQKLIDDIGQEHPRAANQACGLLAQMIDLAKDWGYLPGDFTNPARGIKRFAERPRKRFLSAEELGRLFTALQAEEDILWRDFFLMCLFTGARRGNVAAMRWDQLDLAFGIWTIRNDKASGTSTKNREDTMIPLCPRSLGIIQSRAPFRGDSPWVFPSGRGSSTGHIQSPSKAWQRICRRAGIPDARIHDLRRTLGVWMAQDGVSLKVIQEQMGHRNINSTLIYAHLAGVEQVRQANTAVTQKMLVAGNQRAEVDQH